MLSLLRDPKSIAELISVIRTLVNILLDQVAAKQLDKIQSTLAEISAILIDGFSGKDVILGALERDRAALQAQQEDLNQLGHSLAGLLENFETIPFTDKEIPIVADYLKSIEEKLANMGDLLTQNSIENVDQQILNRQQEISANPQGNNVNAPSVNSLEDDGSIELELTTLSETLANLNNPLLPAFAEAIADVTATINESIAQLDACMAEHACCETGDANAGVVEAAVDKGLIQPAFGLMPLADGAGEAGDQNAQVLEAGLALMDDQSSSPQEAARAVFQDLIPSVEQLDARLGGLFEDIVVNGGDAFESLTSTAKGIIDEFANNVLGNLFQSMGPFGSIVQGVLGAFIPGLAGGGVAQPGAPVLVGERGPELLIPHAPARILNNHATGQFLGGAGGQPMVVNMQNNFQTDVKNAVRAEMMNYSSMLTQATAQTIRNEMNLIYR